MTIGGWITFGLIAFVIILIAIVVKSECHDLKSKICVSVTAGVITVGVLIGMLWYFNSTASGQRSLVDQRSNLNQGLERTITVYTADGEVLAEYEGLIDIEQSEGGYIKFDFEGKRYIYYNCFVESIGDIE